MLPKRLVGKPVDITWVDPDHDWPRFRILDQDGEWVRMEGLAYEGGRHDGSVFWVREREIAQITEIEEASDAPPA